MKGKSIDKNTAMEKLARDACERGCFIGTWLYAEKGEIVSKGAVGFRDTADTLPVEEDTIFQLASVTKQFTAAAVMLLVRKACCGWRTRSPISSRSSAHIRA